MFAGFVGKTKEKFADWMSYQKYGEFIDIGMDLSD
jgi:hypothetical protein